MVKCIEITRIKEYGELAKITINNALCKSCRLCVVACPKNIITISDKISNNKGYFVAEVTDMDKCIGCGFCSTMCPDCVIEVEK